PGSAVVVNEAFARAFWPGLDPIGRQVTLHKAVQGRPDFGEPLPGTVVGVVGDVHHFGLDTPPEPQVYVPFTRNVWGHMSLVVRTAESCGVPPGAEPGRPPGRSGYSDDIDRQHRQHVCRGHARYHWGPRVATVRRMAPGQLRRFCITPRGHRHLRPPGLRRRPTAA